MVGQIVGEKLIENTIHILLVQPDNVDEVNNDQTVGHESDGQQRSKEVSVLGQFT